jgi:hypothetical protein
VGSYRTVVHGTAVITEGPSEAVEDGRYGWGADVAWEGPHSTWFHVAVPVRALAGGAHVVVSRVFVLYSADFARALREIHVYDGSREVARREFEAVPEGDYRSALGLRNSFELEPTHRVQWGIGLSFRIQTGVTQPPDVRPQRLVVAGAGADYEVGATLVGFVASTFRRLARILGR